MSTKWKFEPSDFGPLIHADLATAFANAKLDEWLANATVVYGQGIGPMKSAEWCMNGPDKERYKHTHRALLINIEELPKKPCKHEPVMGVLLTSGEYYPDPNSYMCNKCGVRLKATWEAAE